MINSAIDYDSHFPAGYEEGHSSGLRLLRVAVISRLPAPQDAVRLRDYVTGLADFPGFAELKRSLRQRPQLRSFGVEPGTAGAEEDWQRRPPKNDAIASASHSRLVIRCRRTVHGSSSSRAG
jgi:hypothetical protein